MKKLFAVLLAVMMIASLCAVNAAAWAEYDDPAEEGWTRYSIFNETYVELVDGAGSTYPMPASYDNGQNDNYFQFWKDAVHLYEDRGLNIFNGAQVIITFTGTGIRLCTCYRNDGGFEVEDIAATFDGADVTDELVDLVAPTNNNTDHTPIITFTGLENEEHVLVLTCYSTYYRFSVDYFEIMTAAEETEPTETEPTETKAPETKAPETKAPETKAPETKAPETKAPETKASETKATETNAAGTEASGTETDAKTENNTNKKVIPLIVIGGCIVIAAVAILIAKLTKKPY